MTQLLRGRVYRALPAGFDVDHYFVVVSNNAHNRALPKRSGGAADHKTQACPTQHRRDPTR